MTTYRDSIIQSMNMLAQDPLVRFVGYNVSFGKAGGTLNDVPERHLIETPVAEGLMAGIAIGLSIKGYRPILFFERADFLLNAGDAIVNHLDKIATLSRGEFKPACIIRVVVGNKAKPIFTGPPHTQNFAEAFRHMVSFLVFEARDAALMTSYYWLAKGRLDRNESTMIFEFKDLM